MSALKILGEMKPTRKVGDKRQPVRRTMDENAADLRIAAAKGHSANDIVDAFLIDFPELRSSRPDLDDVAYRRHVLSTYVNFRRANGIRKPTGGE